MLKMVFLLEKRANLSHDEFADYYRDVHAGFGESLPGVKRYTTSVPPRPPAHLERRSAGIEETVVPDQGFLRVDGVSEVYFDDFDSLRRAFTSNVANEALFDEREFVETVHTVVLEETVHVGTDGD